MSYRHDIDDAKLVSMYADKSNRISYLETHFDACARTLRRHLRAKGVATDRKVSTPWTEMEDLQLYIAKKDDLTGSELQAAIPTRTLAAIKGHVVTLQTQGMDIR